MPVIAIVNPKGVLVRALCRPTYGILCVSKGHKVMLGDADVQQSSKAIEPASTKFARY